MGNGIFDGYLLVSDMDGTLISSNHTISKKNRDALYRFTQNGGIFTVASGRMIDAVRIFYDMLPINAPAITHNGAKIYDFCSKKTLFEMSIEEERKTAVELVYKNMPELGIEIYSDEEIYVYRTCRQTERFEDKNYIVHYELPQDMIKRPWTKLLFIGEKDMLDKYEKIYRRDFDTGYSVRSGENYLDVVAGGVSKGNAMKKVADYMKIPMSRTAAVGDNMNDIEMIQAAGIGFAVGNSVPQLKAEADAVLPDCDSDAISQAVSYIECEITGGRF